MDATVAIAVTAAIMTVAYGLSCYCSSVEMVVDAADEQQMGCHLIWQPKNF